MLVLIFQMLMSEPIRVVGLETGGVRLDRMDYERNRLGVDGTFLAADRHDLWHWDRKGTLLRKIGGKGKHAGQLRALGIYYWDGAHYWLVDSLDLKSVIFDREGRFLSESDLWFRQFISAEGRFFGVDYLAYHPKTRQFPPVAKELSFQVVNGKLVIEDVGFPFRKISPKQVQFKLNHKLIWIVPEENHYLVMEQLERKIWVLDEASQAHEREMDPNQPFFPRFIPVELTHYIPPPDLSKFPKTREEYRTWYYGWSRITHFEKWGPYFLVGYETPNPANPAHSLQAVEKVDRDGKTTGHVMLVDGFFMGHRDGEFYFLTRGGQGPKPHSVLVYTFD